MDIEEEKEDLSWWEKCYVKEDNMWLCFIEERLDTESKKKEFWEIKDELESRGIFFEEKEILRFYHGMDYDYNNTM